MYETHRESDGSSNRRCKKEAIWVVEESYIGRRADLYETVTGECCPLFRALRHRAPSSPICLSKVTEQALRLIASIPLIQQREKCCSREEKSTFT